MPLQVWCYFITTLISTNCFLSHVIIHICAWFLSVFQSMKTRLPSLASITRCDPNDRYLTKIVHNAHILAASPNPAMYSAIHWRIISVKTYHFADHAIVCLKVYPCQQQKTQKFCYAGHFCRESHVKRHNIWTILNKVVVLNWHRPTTVQWAI